MSHCPIRLIVADDHPVVLEGIRRFFSTIEEQEVVATAESIEEVHRQLDLHKVDVVVLDIQMAGVTGPDAIASVHQRGPAVILFSLMEEDEIVAALVQGGARGFVSKSNSLDALADATRRAFAGETIFSERLSSLLVAAGAPHLSFTPRERDIYKLLGKQLTPKEIAFELGLAASTVYTYTERIRQQLKVASIAEVAQYAAKWGKLDH